jgi:hypothetical protein
MISRTSNAPLPLPWQIAFTTMGAVVVWAAFELTESGLAASTVGFLLLVLLVIGQRRLALLHPEQALSSPEQIGKSTVGVALGLVVLTAAASIWADRMFGGAWASVVFFVGVATNADLLVRRRVAQPSNARDHRGD